MPTIRPVLGEIELQQVQQLDIDEDQVLVRHAIPALEGDFYQGLGRRGAKVRLRGVLSGPESGEGLARLREGFRAAEPMSFATDIISATRLDEVLIEAMEVTELAGKSARFEYDLRLREFTAPPAVTETATQTNEDVQAEVAQEGDDLASDTSDQVFQDVGTLNVAVNVEEELEEVTALEVLVEGTTLDGQQLYLILQESVDGVFTKVDVPAGTYTVSVFRR